MPKVAILGYYGYGNFGDDRVILGGLRQLFKGWDVEVMAATEQSRYPLFNYKTINSCDLFVLGGGELIRPDCLHFYSHLVRYSWIPAFVHRKFTFTSWVSKIKIPKIILGCGVNAENSSQLTKHVIRDLAQFDYIGLRDNKSVSMLSSFPELQNKVKLFYDCGFALETKRSCRRKSDFAVVIPTDRLNLKAAEKSRWWLQHSLEPYEKTVFLPFGQVDNDDLSTCKTLSDCAKNSEIYEHRLLNTENVLTLLSECAFAYPYRLHGLIISFLAGAKYQHYPYHRKLDRVHCTIQGHTAEGIKAKQQMAFKEALEATM